MKTIVGLFDTYPQAEACVRDLEAAGYGRDNVSIIANQERAAGAAGTAVTATTPDRDRSSVAEGAGTGAVIGGVAGGAAGLIASLAGLAIPGIGPVLAAGPLIAALTGAGVGAAAGGLFGALTSAGVPDEHAHYYNEGVRRGGSLVTVSADDNDAERVMDIMNRHHPVDIEDRAATWRQSGFTVPSTSTRVGGTTTLVGGETAEFGSETTVSRTASPPAMASGMSAGAAVGASSARLEGEQHIPVVEEELRVGKREVETGGARITTRMEERPVEEQVNLREERVHVERRPVDRAATAGDFDQAFKEGTIEVTERSEEAVIAKEARVVEDVVVNKEATERTETVRDTVRRTDVNIQPVEVGADVSGDFERYETDFRTNFQTSNPGGEYTFDHAKPAYRYGYELASDRTRAGDWSSVEPDARRRWEERNPGTWDKFKDAARYAYDRAKSKVNS